MEDNRYKKLTILHSNDLHGDFLAENVSDELVGGVSMLSGYISKVKAEEKNVIYCIAGDMFRGSVIDSEYLGYSTIEIMNMLAPDVVTIGNHETDYGLPHLLFLEKCARFPIINANLHIKFSGTRLFKPYHIIEIDGMKILFIGILTEEVMATTGNERVVGSLVDIFDAEKEIEKICNAFKTVDIDFTVLLTHIGFENDKILAANLDPALGIDVIIGGHSHTLLEKPEKVNDILIVQAGIGTDQIGRFDIIVDTDTNAVASYEWETIPVTSANCPNDPRMAELVSQLKYKTDLKYGRTIRRLNCELTHPDRFQQTSLGHFVVDLFAQCLKCDLFIITSGAIRVPSLGPIITLSDMQEAYPFEVSCFEMKIKGSQLKHLFAFICREDVWNGIVHEFFQISLNWDILYNRHTQQLEHIRYCGHDLEDDEVIIMNIDSFEYNNFEEFFDIPLADIKANGNIRKSATSLKELLFEYLENCEKLPDYPDEGRLVIINE